MLAPPLGVYGTLIAKWLRLLCCNLPLRRVFFVQHDEESDIAPNGERGGRPEAV